MARVNDYRLIKNITTVGELIEVLQDIPNDKMVSVIGVNGYILVNNEQNVFFDDTLDFIDDYEE